ncbi:MAG: hypothetical protein LUG55_00945 [Clostridiales bacterium]|nr:hypothetical protein [Clostridiales bacterium]
MNHLKNTNSATSQKRHFLNAAKIVCILAALFLLLNILWFTWRSRKYGAFTEGMTETEFSSFWVPRYVDSYDGYNYSVKYPNYLSLTGNLALSMPSDENAMYTDALIIWPNANGSYEYGVLLYDDENEWNIYVDEYGQALDSQYDEVVEHHQENISLLFAKANERWGLTKQMGAQFL